MRLLCLHEETVRSLQRLHMPFDDLTPEGLWSTPYHLVGVSAEQCEVLQNFNVDLEDLTPTAFQGKNAGFAEALAISPQTPIRNGQKLRTSHRGKYVEATVQGGKVMLDGRGYDSPASASRGITQDRSEWGFWEYYDEGAGRWNVLSREWQASA